MKVRDVLNCVPIATQVALYDWRLKPICSRFFMPVKFPDFVRSDYLDCDVRFIDSLCLSKDIPVLVIVADYSSEQEVV